MLGFVFLGEFEKVFFQENLKVFEMLFDIRYLFLKLKITIMSFFFLCIIV